MEGIRMIGMSICVTAAAVAIFSMLIPDAKLEQVVKFAVSLFFLASLAAPFASWEGGKLEFSLGSLPVSSWRQADLETAVQQQFTGLAERRLSALMEDALVREGIRPEKVQASIHIAGDGSVSIKQIRIQLSPGDGTGALLIREILEREAGVSPGQIVLEESGAVRNTTQEEIQ